MSSDLSEFRRGVVRPVECLREGWGLVRDQYWLFFGICFVGMLIASLAPLGILAGPCVCGMYYCYFRRARGRRVAFEMLFRGFDYFVQSLIATLLIVIPLLAVLLPCYVVFGVVVFAGAAQQPKGGPPNTDFLVTLLAAYGVFLLVVIALSVVLGVLFAFTYPLIVDRKLTGVQALKTSVRAALGNFGGLLGLVLLNMLLGIVGYLACIVGVFFIMPVTFAANAVAYRRVFPWEDGIEDGPDDDVDPDYERTDDLREG
jgi:hypothetical protein